MQPLPELQEKIEVGVGASVAQMMRLFSGHMDDQGHNMVKGQRRENLHLMQYWMLLFDHAMTISTILTPSLDRDEVLPLSLPLPLPLPLPLYPNGLLCTDDSAHGLRRAICKQQARYRADD